VNFLGGVKSFQKAPNSSLTQANKVARDTVRLHFIPSVDGMESAIISR
jgi:hypothetical protein